MSTIGPVRQGLLARGKQWLGDVLATAGNAANTVSAASNVLLDRAGLPGESVRGVIPGAGDLMGLTGAGTGLQDSANGLPLIRMDRGLMSLQADPRIADIAGLAPLGIGAAAHVGKGLVGGVKQAADDMIEATGTGVSKIWAGPKSATWDPKKAARFAEMEQAGDDFDPHYAWQATGTARVKDGSLLQEIDDSGLELTTDFAPGKPLMSAVKHDKFFEAYPELANEIKVDLEIDPNMGQRGWGAYEHKTKSITVRARNKEDARRIMAHEMNHSASRFEGRATGGSPDSAGRMVDAALKDPELPADLRAKLEPLAGDDHAAYKALQDEVLSRAVESRLKMGPGERGMYSPEYSFDLDQADWIVSHEGTQGVSMADDGTFKPLGPVSKMGKAAAKDMPPFEDLMGMARRVNQETLAARAPAAPAPAPSSLLPEAPAPKEITLNVGLNTNDGAGITEKQVLAELKKLGVKVQTREIANSSTEPTLVATLDKPLTPDQAEQLSVALRQEAIAQRVDGAGELYGPAKDKWGPFNPEFFLDPTPPVAAPKPRRRTKGQTVDNPKRTAFPEIYGDPVALAKQAEAWVEPEDPILRQLFGVGRSDLAKIAERGGNIEASLPGMTESGRGSAAAAKVATRANSKRLVNLLDAGREHAPQLTEGMKGWYVMDPLYRKFVDELGEEAGAAAFKRHITMTGMASPGSDVLTEINRGTTADMLAAQGKFDLFDRYGNKPELNRGKLPREAQSLLGHIYHKTSQAPSMRNYLATGELQMKSPKVPTYIESALVPETGFQTTTPVGDAHWSRGLGLADTRGDKTIKGEIVVPGDSVTNPEIKVLGPWYRDEVAAKAGLESVPAQAIQWGLLGPQTGVDTAIGAPKLELLAKQIRKTAVREGIPPEEALRRLIRKEGQAGKADPKLLAMLSAAVAAAYGISKLGKDTKDVGSEIRKTRESLLEVE